MLFFNYNSFWLEIGGQHRILNSDASQMSASGPEMWLDFSIYGARREQVGDDWWRLGLSALTVDGFSESGGLAALSRGRENRANFDSMLGIRNNFNLYDRVFIESEVGWKHVFGQTRPEADHRFVTAGDYFSIRGVPVNRDALVVDLGGSLKLNENLSLTLNYNGDYGSRGQTHQGLAGVKVSW